MKKIILVLFFNFFILTVIAQIPTSGLVAYYPFNGNANDNSGNGNNGIVTNATLTTDRFGNANSAYNFNGNSLITVTSSTTIQSISNNYSFSVWTKINAFDNIDPSIGQFPIIDKDSACPATSGTTPFLFLADNQTNSGFQISNIDCGVLTKFGKAGVPAVLNMYVKYLDAYSSYL